MQQGDISVNGFADGWVIAHMGVLSSVQPGGMSNSERWSGLHSWLEAFLGFGGGWGVFCSCSCECKSEGLWSGSMVGCFSWELFDMCPMGIWQ